MFSSAPNSYDLRKVVSVSREILREPQRMARELMGFTKVRRKEPSAFDFGRLHTGSREGGRGWDSCNRVFQRNEQHVKVGCFVFDFHGAAT